MAYGVVRTDRLLAIANPAGINSVKYYVSTTATAIENGNVALLSGLMSGEREIYKAVTPAANSALADIVLIATPEVLYDEKIRGIEKFRNEAGAVARGYKLHSGDMFGVTAECLETELSAIAVGNIVELQADTKLAVVSSLTQGSTKVGKIAAIETVGRFKYYVIEVA